MNRVSELTTPLHPQKYSRLYCTRSCLSISVHKGMTLRTAALHHARTQRLSLSSPCIQRVPVVHCTVVPLPQSSLSEAGVTDTTVVTSRSAGDWLSTKSMPAARDKCLANGSRAFHTPFSCVASPSLHRLLLPPHP